MAESYDFGSIFTLYISQLFTTPLFNVTFNMRDENSPAPAPGILENGGPGGKTGDPC